MRARWMLFVSAVVFAGCDAGAPASPALDAGRVAVDAGLDGAVVGEDATVSEAGADASIPVTYDICPDGMAPTFPSIFTRMFSTTSCGTSQPYACHSTTGALPQAEGGTGSLLDFSLDASAVYAELLGADGGGYPSVNVNGDAGEVILRVAPGDASASLLYIKLALPTANDPRYGQAMPPTQTVCPSALDAVRAWIDDGATAQ